MVRRRAGFHANQAGPLPSEKFDDFCAAQSSSDDHLSSGVNAVNLKPVLGKIETNRGNMHSGRLLSVVAFTDDHVMAHRCRGAGAVHPIKKNATRNKSEIARSAVVILILKADG
jgi:hypothetical protein